MERIIIIALFLSACNYNNHGDKVKPARNNAEERKDTAKIHISLVSGRKYFDQKRVDTIIIRTPGLDQFSRGIEVSGALISQLSKDKYLTKTSEYDSILDSFEIKVSSYNPGLDQVRFRINKMGTHGDKLELYDSISIPTE